MKVPRVFVRSLVAAVFTILLAGCSGALLDAIRGPSGLDGTDGLDGTNGADGSTWLSGSGAPGATVGLDGDYYLDTSTGDVFVKAAGSWPSTAALNIKGQAGASGTNGAAGVAGSSIVWKGSLAVAPTLPTLDWAFYDSTLKEARIYDGSAWQTIAKDGADGAAGAAYQAPKVSFMRGYTMIATGGGVVVAASSIPLVLRSSIDSYASNLIPAILNPSALGYGGGSGSSAQFAVAGSGKAIWISNNGGLTWAAAATPASPSATIYSFAKGNGTWVAVGYDSSTGPVIGGIIVVSTDNGLTWLPPTSMPVLNGIYLNEVTWGSGTAGDTFVAVGGSGMILTSADGQTWTQVASTLTANNLTSVAFGNGKWLMAAESSGASSSDLAIYTSGDGTLWTKVLGDAGYLIPSIAYGNGSFVCLTASSALPSVEFAEYYSTTDDGLTWTPTQWMLGYSPSGIAWDGSRFIIIAPAPPS